MNLSNPILLFIALSFVQGICSADDFQVVSNNGVAQITRNGKAVAPHMLYVNRYSYNLSEVNDSWSEWNLEFKSGRNCSNAEIRLYLSFPSPQNIFSGTLQLTELELLEDATGKTVKQFLSDASFQVRNRKSGKDQSLQWEIRNSEVPELYLKAENSPETFVSLNAFPVKQDHVYRLHFRAKASEKITLVSSLFDTADKTVLAVPGKIVREQVGLAAEAGVDFVEIRVNPPFAKPGEEPDFTEIDQNYQAILAVNPNARLIPRLWRKAPEWWAQKYPDELVKYDDGSSDGTPSIASEQYRKDLQEALRRLIRYSESKYAKNMAGYHTTGANMDEWYYYRSWETVLSDYSAPTLLAFRRYLKRKYGSENELRKSWGMPGLSFDTVSIPKPEERRVSSNGAFFLPADAQNVIDFHFFLQENMVDMICGLGDVIREETGKTRLSVCFYGYTYELSSTRNGPATTGHYALRKMLQSDSIDIIAGPVAYGGRHLGGSCTTLSAAESITSAGKLWLQEDDTHTHLARQAGHRAPGYLTGVDTKEESIALLQRNLATAIFRNFGTWWMDIGGVGYYNDPDFWNEHKRLASVEEELRNNPRPFSPVLAEIADEKSMCYVAPAGVLAATRPMLKEERFQLSIAGTPAGQYLLDDLFADRIPARSYIIAGAYALDRKEREALSRHAGKRPTLFGWGTAAIDTGSGKLSPDAVREATGFQVELITDGSSKITLTPEGIAAGISPQVIKEQEKTVSPLFAVVPAEGDIVWARFPDGKAAIVLRPSSVPSVFCGTPILPYGIYRAFAVAAELPLYAPDGTFTLADGSFFFASAPSAGRFTFFPDGKSADPAVRNLRKGENVLIRLQK